MSLSLTVSFPPSRNGSLSLRPPTPSPHSLAVTLCYSLSLAHSLSLPHWLSLPHLLCALWAFILVTFTGYKGL